MSFFRDNTQPIDGKTPHVSLISVQRAYLPLEFSSGLSYYGKYLD